MQYRMFNLQGKDSDKYFKEVWDKLMKNYLLNWNKAKKSLMPVQIDNLVFPEYYPQSILLRRLSLWTGWQEFIFRV
jgi:hypothetical protein